MTSLHYADFNPLTPRGVRQDYTREEALTMLFQFTHPSRGETSCRRRASLPPLRFQSTHPSRGETANRHKRLLKKPFALHNPILTTSKMSILEEKNGRVKGRRGPASGANQPGVGYELQVRIKE